MRFGPGVHFSASDVREGAREREGETEGAKERKRKEEREKPGFLSEGQSAVLNQQLELALGSSRGLEVISIHNQDDPPL